VRAARENISRWRADGQSDRTTKTNNNKNITKTKEKFKTNVPKHAVINKIKHDDITENKTLYHDHF
jgi:hypothetical protein